MTTPFGAEPEEYKVNFGVDATEPVRAVLKKMEDNALSAYKKKVVKKMQALVADEGVVDELASLIQRGYGVNDDKAPAAMGEK